MSEAPQVVVVGAASRDLVDDDARGWRLGGGVAYSALALARLGLRVGALIGVDGPARTPRRAGPVRDAGAERAGRPPRTRPGVRQPETPTGACSSAEVSDPYPARRCPTTGPVRRRVDVRAGGGGDPRGVGRGPAARRPRGGRLAGAAAGAASRAGPSRGSSRSPSPLIERADLVGVGTRRLRPGHPARAPRLVRRPGRHAPRDRRGPGGTAIETAHDGSSRARSRWAAIPIAATRGPDRRGRHVPRRGACRTPRPVAPR